MQVVQADALRIAVDLFAAAVAILLLLFTMFSKLLGSSDSEVDGNGRKLLGCQVRA